MWVCRCCAAPAAPEKEEEEEKGGGKNEMKLPRGKQKKRTNSRVCVLRWHVTHTHAGRKEEEEEEEEEKC